MSVLKPDSKEFRIVIFGSGGVGKSSLIQQLMHSDFSEKYDPYEKFF